MAKVISLNISEKKGVKKTPVNSVEVKVEHGIVGDAHSGNWHRQISLLANESIDNMRVKLKELKSGDFAENITTEGIELKTLKVGTQMKIGNTLHEVTQIGKECHSKCQIFHAVGDCVMPKEGIFTKVLEGGKINVGDEITLLEV